MVDFLSQYWSQIALLLGIFGYIIKIIFEARVKIKEIKFSHLHLLRTKEIKEFYLSFLDVEDMLKRYNARAFSITNLDETFYLEKDLKINSFKKNLESLKLIIDKSKSNNLESLINEFQEIDNKICVCESNIRCDLNKEESIQLLNDTYVYLDKNLPQLKLKLEKILRDINGV
ncbi:MAG: hypothetical protein ISS19_14285 [Bacteroidales bacterium]|nr:hypothetical protein [Bacteroidales bacterium]